MGIVSHINLRSTAISEYYIGLRFESFSFLLISFFTRGSEDWWNVFNNSFHFTFQTFLITLMPRYRGEKVYSLILPSFLSTSLWMLLKHFQYSLLVILPFCTNYIALTLTKTKSFNLFSYFDEAAKIFDATLRFPFLFYSLY